jgi:outer membrane usher protein
MWHWTRASRLAFSSVALLLAVAGSARAGDANAPPPGFTLAVLAVTINREAQREPIVALRDRSSKAWVAGADLTRWRLRLPAAAPTLHQGERYFPLAAFAGLAATVDERDQTLTIDAPASLFAATRIDAEADTGPLAERSASGGFVNYSVLAMRAEGRTSASSAFEAGAFGAWGVVTSSASAWTSDGTTHVTRLESAWTYAMPERLATARVGDAISRGGSWGNAIRFGGVQIATDFATRPTLVLTPGQSVAGQATVPSTVDVFVNNALVAQQSVRPGPFSVANIAPVTGAGNVTLVVRDELGREQVITRPFYASATLLRPGLVDFSFDAGLVRRNFGVTSDDYGPWFGSATYRRGLGAATTGEARVEAQASLANVGVAADALVGDVGVLSASAAAGHNRIGSGARVSAGFERQSLGLSFNVRGTWASPRFRQLGDFESSITVDHELLASAGYGFARFGTVTLAYVARSYREQAAAKVASLGYSLGLERWGYVGASLSRVRTDAGSTQMNVLWTLPFGGATSATLGADRVHGPAGATHDEVSLSLQRDLPAGEGFGWRLRASDHGTREAEGAYQNRYGTYSAEISQVQGRTGERVVASGGVGVIGDTVFLSRPIDDSFGLVRLPGYPDVRIYAENQEIGRTNASGTLIVPRLLPYQRNAIRIEQGDLPFDAEFEALSHDAVPFARSGVVLDFAVRPARGALLRIVQENGDPVPAGARVSLEGQERSFPVALDGEAYVAGLSANNRAVVSWRNEACALDFAVPASNDPQPRLGTLVCRRSR